MIKFTLFLLALFGASFILQGTRAQELTCQVDYLSVDQPGIGVISRSVILSQGEEGEASNNVLREPDFMLDQFTLTGYCDCGLLLHSEVSYGGCYVRSQEIYDGSVHRYVDDIWTRTESPRSFQLDCFF